MNTLLKLALMAVLIMPAFQSIAQDDEDINKVYDDLRILYMDEKYEKLISKAENYVESDKTRKDAEPYLYLSKAYYEMSRLEQYQEEYPSEKSFRNALKWAKKYRSKDKDGSLFEQNELYFNELKSSAMEEAAGLMSDQKYSRAKRYYDAITDFDPTDAGAWLMLGYCQIQMRAVNEANLALQEAGEVMTTLEDRKLNSTDRKILREGVVTYTNYLIEQGMRDSAEVVVNLAAPVLQDDKEFEMIRKKVQ